MSSVAAPDQATVASNPVDKPGTNKPEANTTGDSALSNTKLAAYSEESLPSIDEDSHKEETKEDILNKIDTETAHVLDDNLDSHVEDSILNEDDEHQQTSGNKSKIVYNFESTYENNTDEEFKSLYKEGDAEILKVELMAVDKLDITGEPVVLQKYKKSQEKINDKDVPMEDVTASNSNYCIIDNAQEPNQISTTEKPSEGVEIQQEPNSYSDDNPLPKTQSNDEILKVPDKVPVDLSVDDETQLLNISMICETEEDDVCATKDQSEKTETDHEKSDCDYADIAKGFVVLEDYSHTDDSVVIEDTEPNKTEKINDQDMEGDNSENDLVVDEDNNADGEKRKSKRTLSPNKTIKLNAKKPKLVDELRQEKLLENEPKPQNAVASLQATPIESKESPKLQTLASFADFMQCRKITKKLTRSDLEEICIQKICEVLVLKSLEGELHQTIRQQEQHLATLHKDVQQLHKQYKDLDTVHKRLLAELKTQKDTGLQKPLVPLKIARSVGLQVRLNPGNEANQNRRRQQASNAKPKTILSPLGRPKVEQQPAAVRQVLGTLQNQMSPINSAPSMLSQALQQQKQKPKPVEAKRATPSSIKKPAEAVKKLVPSVIDLTNEDDIKFRTVSAPNARVLNKSSGGTSLLNQNKPANKLNALPSALPPGLRLATAPVISSTATSSPHQMLYILPTITSNAAGQQKVAFVNFQPTNIMPGTLNSAVINKPSQSLTITNVATTSTVSSASRPKHPARLPAERRVNPNPNLKRILPKPILTIKKLDKGIILQWKMPYNLELYETIASYQLYAYQETASLPSTDMWKKVGDVQALVLPMACTLAEFTGKNKYYFAVRAVDVFRRIGAFSDPEEISM